MSNKNVYDSNLNPLLLYYQTILGEREREIDTIAKHGIYISNRNTQQNNFKI